MEVNEFFNELKAHLLDLNFKSKKYPRSLGFELIGYANEMVHDLDILMRNAELPHPSDHKVNNEMWRSIVARDKQYGFKLFLRFNGNKRLKAKLREFLDYGKPNVSSGSLSFGQSRT